MRPSSFAASGLVLLLVFAGPQAARASQDAYAQYAEKLEAADAAAQRGARRDAIVALSAAYHALPAADRGTRLGADVVERVARLAQEDYLDGSKDREVLDVAVALLDAHLEDLGRVAPDADPSLYQQYRRRLDTARSTLDGSSTSEAAPAAAPEEQPRPSRSRRSGEAPSEADEADPGAPAGTAGNDRTRRRRQLTLGLGLGLGGAVAATGIAFLGYRASFSKRTERDYETNRNACEALPQPTDPTAAGPCDATESWYEGEQDKIRTHLVIGSVLLSAGAAAMIATGVVVLVKDKRGRETARFGASPMASGFALVGQF